MKKLTIEKERVRSNSLVSPRIIFPFLECLFCFFSLSPSFGACVVSPRPALDGAMSDSGGGGDGEGDGNGTAKPLTNADFRALLSAPRPDAAAATAASNKKSAGQQHRRNQQRPSRDGEGGSKYR